MTTIPDAAVTARGLAKNYGRHQALLGIDLDIPRATVYGVIGPNGAGKTTTMRLMLDIIRPSAGELHVLGATPRDGGAALRRRIGYLPGELHLEARIRARDLLTHYSEISGTVRHGVVDSLAQRLGLDLSRQVRALSKGNKQKLGLIQAFMHEPELLVLDEPTSGLDPLVQQEFHAMLREAKANGQTVFLSSHVLSEVQQTADEVAILRAGQHRATVARWPSSARPPCVVCESSSPKRMPPLRARPSGVLPGVGAIAEVHERAGHARPCSAALDSHVDAFVKAIARLDLVDLTIEEPDLEESVLGFYGNGGANDEPRAAAVPSQRSPIRGAASSAGPSDCSPPSFLYLPLYPSFGGRRAVRGDDRLASARARADARLRPDRAPGRATCRRRSTDSSASCSSRSPPSAGARARSRTTRRTASSS